MMITVATSQRLLKPSNSLLKASLIRRFDIWNGQIWPQGETVSCPYSSKPNETCTRNQKGRITFPNVELVVNMIGILFLLLEYGPSSLGTFRLEVRVICLE